MRRCFFHYITFPDRETLSKIVDVHYPGIKQSLLKAALEAFFGLRDIPGLKKKPSTSDLLDWRMGGFNTLVLLASSFTVALSIHYAQKNDQRKLMLNLLLTFLCACIFLVVKYFEYSAKFEHGVFAGAAFDPHGVSHGLDSTTTSRTRPSSSASIS